MTLTFLCNQYVVWYGNSLFDTIYKYTHLNILHNKYNIGQETTLRIQRVLAAMYAATKTVHQYKLWSVHQYKIIKALLYSKLMNS